MSSKKEVKVTEDGKTTVTRTTTTTNITSSSEHSTSPETVFEPASIRFPSARAAVGGVTSRDRLHSTGYKSTVVTSSSYTQSSAFQERLKTLMSSAAKETTVSKEILEKVAKVAGQEPEEDPDWVPEKIGEDPERVPEAEPIEEDEIPESTEDILEKVITAWVPGRSEKDPDWVPEQTGEDPDWVPEMEPTEEDEIPESTAEILEKVITVWVPGRSEKDPDWVPEQTGEDPDWVPEIEPTEEDEIPESTSNRQIITETDMATAVNKAITKRQELLTKSTYSTSTEVEDVSAVIHTDEYISDHSEGIETTEPDNKPSMLYYLNPLNWTTTMTTKTDTTAGYSLRNRSVSPAMSDDESRQLKKAPRQSRPRKPKTPRHNVAVSDSSHLGVINRPKYRKKPKPKSPQPQPVPAVITNLRLTQTDHSELEDSTKEDVDPEDSPHWLRSRHVSTTVEETTRSRRSSRGGSTKPKPNRKRGSPKPNPTPKPNPSPKPNVRPNPRGGSPKPNPTPKPNPRGGSPKPNPTPKPNPRPNRRGGSPKPNPSPTPNPKPKVGNPKPDPSPDLSTTDSYNLRKRSIRKLNEEDDDEVSTVNVVNHTNTTNIVNSKSVTNITNTSTTINKTNLITEVIDESHDGENLRSRSVSPRRSRSPEKNKTKRARKLTKDTDKTIEIDYVETINNINIVNSTSASDTTNSSNTKTFLTIHKINDKKVEEDPDELEDPDESNEASEPEQNSYNLRKRSVSSGSRNLVKSDTTDNITNITNTFNVVNKSNIVNTSNTTTVTNLTNITNDSTSAEEQDQNRYILRSRPVSPVAERPLSPTEEIESNEVNQTTASKIVNVTTNKTTTNINNLTSTTNLIDATYKSYDLRTRSGSPEPVAKKPAKSHPDSPMSSDAESSKKPRVVESDSSTFTTIHSIMNSLNVLNYWLPTKPMPQLTRAVSKEPNIPEESQSSDTANEGDGYYLRTRKVSQIEAALDVPVRTNKGKGKAVKRSRNISSKETKKVVTKTNITYISNNSNQTNISDESSKSRLRSRSLSASPRSPTNDAESDITLPGAYNEYNLKSRCNSSDSEVMEETEVIMEVDETVKRTAMKRASEDESAVPKKKPRKALSTVSEVTETSLNVTTRSYNLRSRSPSPCSSPTPVIVPSVYAPRSSSLNSRGRRLSLEITRMEYSSLDASPVPPVYKLIPGRAIELETMSSTDAHPSTAEDSRISSAYLTKRSLINLARERSDKQALLRSGHRMRTRSGGIYDEGVVIVDERVDEWIDRSHAQGEYIKTS